VTRRPGLGATYRLQLRPGNGFAEAAGIVPYLARLGIETLYLSPVAEAVPKSAHGYDGTDPTRLRAELGGEPGYDALVSACARHGLGICIDVVPNHLAAWPGGGWWRQLLEHGPDGPMAGVFDVDWEAGDGKVVLPLLDRPLVDAIGIGLVRMGRRDGEPVVLVGEADLPVRPGSGAADVSVTLRRQHYRLADFHDPAGRNYRRFFDIDGLAGVRVEDPAVRARTHGLVVDLARSGRVSALRVDHVDGLRSPSSYLAWLVEQTGVPVVVEKILTGDERLREDWPVEGTTGYETIDDVGGVLVDPHGFDRLVAAGREEGDADVSELTVKTRRLVADRSFSNEIGRAAGRLGVAAGALRDVLVRLGRYRTYLEAPGGPRPDAPVGLALRRELDETAVWRSLRSPAGTDEQDEVIDLLLTPGHRDEALRLQQLSGALMAKGVEDTAWYRLAGPLPFCEVGGDPARPRAGAPDRWHERAAARATAAEGGLVPGTTHDTKRAQDVRSRLYALSEMAGPFDTGLRALRAALGLATDGGDLAFETRVAAQLALGVLPPLGAAGDTTAEGPGDAGGESAQVAARLGDALVKGAREAKRRSSWTDPDEAYESALRRLAQRMLEDQGALLRRSFGPVLEEVLRLGALNSLSAVVLRHAMPGIPDCYQGDEAWNLSLVDPDNRRPVDFPALARELEGVEGVLERQQAPGAGAAALRRSWRDGRVKLLVTAACLRARRGPGGPALTPGAAYVRLAAAGPAAASVLAFARRAATPDGPSWAVAVVTRLGGRLETAGDDLPSGPSYGGTVVHLPADAPPVLGDAITGRTVTARGGALQLEEALADLPVTLLVAGPGG